MDFRELSYVLAIAQYQSLSKASSSLFVTQPTLTKFLQNLEKQLGQPLFRRIGNRFLLTYAGERYVEKARMILDLKESLDHELRDIKKENIGVLNIGVPLMRSPTVFPSVIPQFIQKYPNIEINTVEDDSGALEGLVLNGQLDLAFFVLSGINPDLDYEVINDEEVLLVMPASHPLAERAVLRRDRKYPFFDLKDAANEKFIFAGDRQRMGNISKQLLRNAGIEPRVILKTRNKLTALQMVSQGYGLTFSLESHLTFAQFRGTIRCYSVGDSVTSAVFGAVYRKGIYQPQYVKDFIQIAKENIK